MGFVAAIGAMAATYALMPFPPNRAAATSNLVSLVVVGVCAYFLWGAR